MICAPFLDTDFDPSERVAMLCELRRRGYPRALVFLLRVFAGAGLWWNLIAWEWANLDLTDVLFGYSLNFGIAALILASVALFAFISGGSASPPAVLAVASAALCLLAFLAANRSRKRGARSPRR